MLVKNCCYTLGILEYAYNWKIQKEISPHTASKKMLHCFHECLASSITCEPCIHFLRCRVYVSQLVCLQFDCMTDVKGLIFIINNILWFQTTIIETLCHPRGRSLCHRTIKRISKQPLWLPRRHRERYESTTNKNNYICQSWGCAPELLTHQQLVTRLRVDICRAR
jgi:hypothetical protein